MNRERIEALIAHLEGLKAHEDGTRVFDMSTWAFTEYDDDHEGAVCGTPACIAGHAHALFDHASWRVYLRHFGNPTSPYWNERVTDDVLRSEQAQGYLRNGFVHHPERVAMNALGLSLAQANDLFYRTGKYWKDENGDTYDNDIDGAVKALRNLLNEETADVV